MSSHVTGQSLGGSSSMRSMLSGSRKTERVLEQLRNDSEDISRALDLYLQERNEINEKTARAMREYEVEIADIGDVSDVEEEYSEEEKEEDRNAVDHNLRRHLGVSGAEEGCGGYDDEYGNDFEDMFSTGQESKKSKTLNSTGLPPVSYEKKGNPSLEVKEAIRNKLFSFLDENREAEADLDIKIQEMKKSMSETEMTEAEFVRMQTKCDAVENSLFNLQKENHSKLLEFMGDYKPTLSGKLWGNDPDYRKTMKELKKRVHT